MAASLESGLPISFNTNSVASPDLILSALSPGCNTKPGCTLMESLGNYEEESHWLDSLNKVVDTYNYCLKAGNNIRSQFQKEREIAKLQGRKFYAVYDEIGKMMEQNTPL